MTKLSKSARKTAASSAVYHSLDIEILVINEDLSSCPSTKMLMRCETSSIKLRLSVDKTLPRMFRVDSNSAYSKIGPRKRPKDVYSSLTRHLMESNITIVEMITRMALLKDLFLKTL